MNKKILHWSKKLLIIFSVYLMMFLIVFFSSELSTGIKNGINISFNLAIPSMFIFIIFSNVIMNSKLKYAISRPFEFMAKHVFKVQKNNCAIILLSLLGGYPTGAKLIDSSVRQNRMTKQEASNMLCYCVNCSPAFLISGVGVSLFSSRKIGIYLYISQIVACIITGYIMSFFAPKIKSSDVKPRYDDNTSFSILFVRSVNDSIKTMIIICGFIIAFSAFMPVLSVFINSVSKDLGYILQGFLEVTSGCNSLANISSLNKIIWAAAFTSFGGICVHMQIYAMVSESGISMKRFFATRIIYTAISVGFMKVVLMLSPQTLNCISYNSNIKKEIYSVSATATIFMVLLSIMLLFFTKKSDKMNINTSKIQGG